MTERPEFTEPDTRSLERRVFDARRQEIERRIDALLQPISTRAPIASDPMRDIEAVPREPEAPPAS